MSLKRYRLKAKSFKKCKKCKTMHPFDWYHLLVMGLTSWGFIAQPTVKNIKIIFNPMSQENTNNDWLTLADLTKD